MTARLAHSKDIYQSLVELFRLKSTHSKWLLLILVSALAARVLLVLLSQTEPVHDAVAYDKLAWRLASGEGYVNDKGEPEAFWPVGYPVFLAVIYLAFGHSWIVGGIANAFLGTVGVFLTYRLAREVLSSSVSLIAAGLVALYPSRIIAYTPSLLTETLHTVLVLAVILATLRLAHSPTWKNVALLGILIGVSVYIRPILLLFPCAVTILLILKWRGNSVRSAIGLGVFTLLVSLVIILPWTVRNFLELDGFVFTATNGGYNFYMGNGPGGTGMFRDVSDTFAEPKDDPLRYQKGFGLGIEYILNNPGEWIVTLPKKAFNLWVGDFSNLILRRSGIALLCSWAVLVIAAIVAMFAIPIRCYWLRFPAVIFPLTILYWTAFHLMFFGLGRFHTQMIPIVVIIAVHLFILRSKALTKWHPLPHRTVLMWIRQAHWNWVGLNMLIGGKPTTP